MTCLKTFFILPYEVHISQQGQDVAQDAFRVPGQQRGKHVDELQSHLTANHSIQKVVLCNLGQAAPVEPE